MPRMMLLKSIFKPIVDIVRMSFKSLQDIQHHGSWYIFLRCCRACNIPFHLRSQFALTYALTRPQVVCATRRHPKINFKHLGNYLALFLNINSRAAILINHYQQIVNLMKDDFTENLITGDVVLWATSVENDEFDIALAFPDYGMEGDLSLVYNFNSKRLFTMSFTFTPGAILDLPDEQVLFITRVQGLGGNFDSIRNATRNLHDISPLALLLVAVQGVAASCGIPLIAGISVADQVTVGLGKSLVDSRHVYDDFWMNQGGEPVDGKFFLFPVPLPRKPLAMIKRNHRCRVKRKRLFKDALTQQVSVVFTEKCRRPLPIESQSACGASLPGRPESPTVS